MTSLFKIPYRTQNKQVDRNFEAVRDRLRYFDEQFTETDGLASADGSWVSIGSDTLTTKKDFGGIVRWYGQVQQCSLQSNLCWGNMNDMYTMRQKIADVPTGYGNSYTGTTGYWYVTNGYVYCKGVRQNSGSWVCYTSTYNLPILLLVNDDGLYVWDIMFQNDGAYVKPIAINYLSLYPVQYKSAY
jgi:hypothetical protein